MHFISGNQSRHSDEACTSHFFSNDNQSGQLLIADDSNEDCPFIGRYEGKYKQGQRFAIYNDKGYGDGRSNDEFKPGVVLDPFFGSGTTAEVAMSQGKDWVGIELNEDYEKISHKRLKPTIIEKKTREKAKNFWI